MKFNTKQTRYSLFAFLSLLATSLQAAETFDTTFGQGLGYVTTTFGSGVQFNATQVQSDGKIVAAGYTQNPNQQVFIARYNSDGTLDTGFGTDGVVATNVGSSFSETIVNGLALQSDGGIVVVGNTFDGDESECFIARYTSSGDLDGTFGSGGFVVDTFGSDGGQFNGVVIQSDGTIVAAGVGSFSGSPNGLLVRFTTTGSLDTTFGGTGIVTLAEGTSTSFKGVVLDSSGNIIATGTNQAGFGPQAITARYTSTGSLDSSFGTSGIVTTQIDSNATTATSLAIDSSGNILVAGSTIVEGNNELLVIRYTSAGELDASFGSGGSVTTPIGGPAFAASIAIDADGKIVIDGYATDDIDLATMARYSSSGVLDTTFGDGGIVVLSRGAGSRWQAVVLQTSDDRAVAAGFEIDPTTSSQKGFIARFNKNNSDFVKITSIAEESTINTKIPIISGISSAAGAQVDITINGTLFTSVATDGSGNWNAGVSSVLLVGSNLIEADLIVGGDIIVSDEVRVTVIDNLGEDAVFAYDTTTQTALTGTFADVTFSNNGKIGTWSHTLNTASFTCNKTGTYEVGYIGTAVTTSGIASVSAALRLSNNGTPVSGSQINDIFGLDSSTISSGSTLLLDTSVIIDLAAGDVLTVQAAGSNTQLAPVTLGGTDSPSAQLLITRIA